MAASKWFEELDEAYSVMRVKEIQILDVIRTTVDPSTETDTMCVYEFLKQNTPLLNLIEKDAVNVFKEELLSRQLQRLVPKTFTTLRELRLFLVERFRDLDEILEKWIGDLETAASTRQGGTRYRFEALVAVLKLINRATALTSEVPLLELLAVLAHPRTLAQLRDTLQHRDVEGYQQELIWSVSAPPRGRGLEALLVLRKYLERTIQELRDAGPPAPMVYCYDNNEDPEAHCEDVEYVYCNIQEPQVYAGGPLD